MNYRTVLAIDVGFRNLGYCLVDSVCWQTPLAWGKADLWGWGPEKRRTPTKEQIVEITVQWVQDNQNLFAQADAVILENQMRTPFIIMNAVIHALHVRRVKVAHPMKVGSFWGLPKTRTQKKEAGIAVCRRNGATFPPNTKLDDLADAWLMAVWGLIQAGGLSIKSIETF